MDRPFVVRGRLADPTRVDEVVVTEKGAGFAGLHVGSVVPIGIFTNAQVEMPGCCSADRDRRTVSTHRSEGGRDRGARQRGRAGRRRRRSAPIRSCSRRRSTGNPPVLRVLLGHPDPGRRWKPRRRGGHCRAPALHGQGRGFRNREPGDPREGRAGHQARVDRARRLRGHRRAGGAADRRARHRPSAARAEATTRRIASPRRWPRHDHGGWTVGPVGAVVVGAVLAVGVAVGLSPLAPIGVVRPGYPDVGVAFDWTVLGVGLVVVVVLSGRGRRDRVPTGAASLGSDGGARVHPTVPLAGASGVPGLPASSTGIRFALDPGRRHHGAGALGDRRYRSRHPWS